MANHASAKKKVRQIARKTEVNRIRLSRIRTFIKKVETAVATGNKTQAQEALRAAQPEMVRGAQVGILHRNTVARKLSRLSAKIKALA